MGRIPFLSTPSARRATRVLPDRSQFINISIHALREEGDVRPRPSPSCCTYFYPRPPRGGRRIPVEVNYDYLYFYPRPPRGGRPGNGLPPVYAFWISIHALREEGDRGMRRGSPDLRNFYPRPPRGGRLRMLLNSALISLFLSTPSARRATPYNGSMFTKSFDFYPRPPRGGRQQKQRQNLYFQTNYTTFCTNLEEL